MTLSAAAARGLARPERHIVRGWLAICPTCDYHGQVYLYKGTASEDARRHNEEVHGE